MQNFNYYVGNQKLGGNHFWGSEIIPFSVAPQFVPMSTLGLSLGNLARNYLGNQGLGQPVGRFTGNLLPFSAAPQFVPMGAGGSALGGIAGNYLGSQGLGQPVGRFTG
ncbi:hypothetical protein ACTFRV_27615, partial [Bacillus cereus group sp. MYBK185-1]|uniref:hypothetical protein n=1 Tax=Bacillus cereus group sp. MYBK185-1 TaxID=3450672 RepID=UPI003F7A74FB